MEFETTNIVVNRLLEYAAVFACGLLIGTLSVISFKSMLLKGPVEIRSETIDTHITNNISTNSSLLPPKPDHVPRHIAVIMDGNRRYGRKTHGDPLRGHWVGGQTLVDFVQWCMEDGVEILTVYAFSSENWNRDATEIDTLMSIFSKYSETLLKEATEKNVKVKILSTGWCFVRLLLIYLSSYINCVANNNKMYYFRFPKTSIEHARNYTQTGIINRTLYRF